MIPQGGSIKNQPVQTVQQPSKTYKLDFAAGRITGKTDGLDAVKQAIFKILQTDRFRYLIYSFDYGTELPNTVGTSPLFVQSEVTRLVEEALFQDDRIRRIENLNAEINGDSMLLSFIVVTVFGNVEVSQEVNPSV